MLRAGSALLLLALAGCAGLAFLPPDAGPRADGGKGGGIDAGALEDAGLALAQACSALDSARCEYLQRCGLIGPGTTYLAACERYYGDTACNPTLWPLRVTAGTLRYDPALGQSCADDWSTFSCAAYQSEPESCRAMLSPNASLGSPCYGGDAVECADGVCRGAQCPYSCRAPGLIGEPCVQDQDCDGDAGYCQFMGNNAASLCEPYQGIRAPCSATLECAPDLYCSGADAGHCLYRLDGGAGCSTTAQCPLGWMCLPETRTCQPAGPLPQGASCYAEQSCVGPLTCVGSAGFDAGTCLSGGDAGASCATSRDCEPDLACDSSGACGSRLGNGQYCALDRDCWVGSRCVNGICTHVPLPGEDCLTDLCLYGACTPDGGSGVCTGFAPTGAACQSDLACLSELCVAGTCAVGCSPP